MSAVPPVIGKIVCHEAQFRFLMSTANISIAVAGIRGGKTHAGALKTILYSIEHSCNEDQVHLVCSPTYPMSRQPISKIFKLLYDKKTFPINPLIKYSKSERTFTLLAADGGTTKIQVVSMSDPDKLRGIEALSAWLDEGAYMTEYAWEVVQGRLADNDGPCWITTTPAGYNFIHDIYVKAMEEKENGVPLDQRERRFFHWTSLANTFIKERGLRRLQDRYDSRTYAQEVEGLFVKVAGLVYHSFGQRNIAPWRVDPRQLIHVGQDFNVGHMASSFSQKVGSTLRVFHERAAPDSDTFDLARYLDRYASEHRIAKDKFIIYPDASGAARNTAGKSDHQVLRLAGFRVRAPKRNPFVKDRVNSVNGLLRARNGVPRMFVDPSCKEHIKCFRNQIWAEDSDPPEPDKEHGFDHMMDACGYKVWTLFPLRMGASLGRSIDEMRRAA